MKKTAATRHGIPPATRADSVLSSVTNAGYSITAQRRTLVNLILEQSGRFSADGLVNELQVSGHSVGRATVFRTLEMLTRLGHLGRVEDGDRSAYTVCGEDHHHHHLVCTNCGQVIHVDGCPVDDVLQEIEDRTGFRIHDHRVELTGLCPSCQL